MSVFFLLSGFMEALAPSHGLQVVVLHLERINRERKGRVRHRGRVRVRERGSKIVIERHKH